MPIYAYRCGSCGHAKDVLQKISDPPLTVCPACGASTFSKQLTAAGFQLKGSGWYVTDFRGGPAAPAAPAADSRRQRPRRPSLPTADAKPADASTPARQDRTRRSAPRRRAAAAPAPATERLRHARPAQIAPVRPAGLVPLAITIWVLQWIIGMLDRHAAGSCPQAWHP